MKKLIIIIAAISLVTAAIVTTYFITNTQKPKIAGNYTNVTITNSSNQDSVKVFLTIQAPNSVLGLFGIKDTINTSKGYFYAKKDSTYSLNDTTELLGAVISFVGDNLPCQIAIPKGYPQGINIFEFSINTKYESFDVSLVDGLNAILKITADSTWTTGDYPNQTKFDSIVLNPRIQDNINKRGVYPYNCQVCSSRGINPPQNCLSLPDTCNLINACQAMRTSNKGGSINITYKGDIQILK